MIALSGKLKSNAKLSGWPRASHSKPQKLIPVHSSDWLCDYRGFDMLKKIVVPTARYWCKKHGEYEAVDRNSRSYKESKIITDCLKCCGEFYAGKATMRDIVLLNT